MLTSLFASDLSDAGYSFITIPQEKISPEFKAIDICSKIKRQMKGE